MSEVKISVCIPVYNGAEYIEAAINSVLQQSITDFELIIVDNKSTDDTISLIKKHTDVRIKLFQNESNIGMLGNWNKAMSLAKGTYVKILPADDLLYPDCLLLQSTILDKDTNKKISLVCGRKNVINSEGKILFNRGYANKEIEINGISAINKTIKSGGNIIGESGAVLFRREIIEKIGFFGSEFFYTLDIDYWFKILLHGNLYAIPNIVSAFRLSSSSASVTVADTQKSDNIKFTKKTYHTKEYKIRWINYQIGIINVIVLTQVKKLIYKFIIK